MHKYKVELRKIRISEYQALRKTTGWGDLSDDTVSKALSKDIFSICILDNTEIIGIGRVIGDSAVYYYIQDIIVLPKYKGKGVGKLIMKHVENYLNNHAANNSFVGLMAAQGVQDFYKKFGYQERPKNRPGMYKIMQK